MKPGNDTFQPLGRRSFLAAGTLILATTRANAASVLADSVPDVKLGLLTDLHYADKRPAGTRYYRETLPKLEEAARQFEKEQPNLIVELGDLIDAADQVAVELDYLHSINDKLVTISSERHYVLGNHCVDTLTKEEFLHAVGQPQSFYSFNRNGFHFVVLDCCFREDGVAYGRKNFQWTDTYLPQPELEWLKSDLQSNDLRTIVFVHQRLDVSNSHGVKNGGDVRQVLESTGNVLAVFQGHSHHNDYHEIQGIHYCTLAAMVEGTGPENNGFSILNIHRDGTLLLSGFRRQASYQWESHT